VVKEYFNVDIEEETQRAGLCFYGLTFYRGILRMRQNKVILSILMGKSTQKSDLMSPQFILDLKKQNNIYLVQFSLINLTFLNIFSSYFSSILSIRGMW